MPANIVLRDLTNPPKKGSTSPVIATRSDLRDGSRGSSGVTGGDASLNYFQSNDTLVINTDGALSFGASNQKPRFIWKADDGLAPNPQMGDSSQWGDGESLANGQISTEKVADGQSQSVVFDHGLSSGAALSPITLGAGRFKMLFRRRFEDFDVVSATAIRTRIETPLLSGTLPSPGDLVTGATSGATGIVQSVDPGVGGDATIFYEPSGGSINDPSPTIFEYGETMQWPGGSGTNGEGTEVYRTGTFYTFNHKTIRFYPLGRSPIYHNVYCGDGKPGYTPSRPQVVVEAGTGDTGGITNPAYSQLDYARQWNTELFLLKESSDVDVADGSMIWRKNGTLIADGSVPFATRTAAYPEPKETVYQSQVSNGAQPGSRVFFDYIYADDSHDFIALRDESSGRFIPLPKKLWTDNRIEAHYLGLLPLWTHIDIYKNGELLGSIDR